MEAFLRRRIGGHNLKNNMRKKRKHLRASTNVFNMSNTRFVELFRFPKDLCKNLIAEVVPYMEAGKNKNRLPRELRFLVALRFFAQGSYQLSVGQDFMLSVSQTVVSRCVHEVSNIFNMHLLTKYVKFPASIEEMQAIKFQFYEKHGFPGVIGAIDGTHIKIKKPHKDVEHAYVCRKGGHSINAQVVCDYNLKILDVNARFGGTAHDAFVWRASALQTHLEQRYEEAGRLANRNWWLLGDSGYPLVPFLMTPIQGHNLSLQEEVFNIKHRKARNCVERCFGVLKSRFRCLSGERVLCYTPATAGKIINSCVVLHNILIQNNIVELDVIDTEGGEDITNSSENEDEEMTRNTSEGIAMRRRIVMDFIQQ